MDYFGRGQRELTVLNWIVAAAIVALSAGIVFIVSWRPHDDLNSAFGAIIAGGFVAAAAYLTVTLKQREKVRERQLMEHEIWQSGVRLAHDGRTKIAGWETLQGYFLEYPQGHLGATALLRLAAQYPASDGLLASNIADESGCGLGPASAENQAAGSSPY